MFFLMLSIFTNRWSSMLSGLIHSVLGGGGWWVGTNNGGMVVV